MFSVTTGAVKTPFAKLPPLVQLTVGTIDAALLSFTVIVMGCDWPEMTVIVLEEKLNVGAVVSTTGVGGAVVPPVFPPVFPLPPAPHAARLREKSEIMAEWLMLYLKLTMGSPVTTAECPSSA